MMAGRNRYFQPALACALLFLATLAVYWPVENHAFINYDDPAYVTENPHISPGLTWEGLAWAFGRLHGERTYWHPLTWVSHMVDCHVFGLKPAGHHLMNVLFHALNAMLVFLVFLRMTGAFWRCAVLAGLFALHPLQVDTVAWVAERKNLLSTFIGLLAIWAYVCHAKPEENAKPAVSRFTFHASRFYWLSLLLYALSLMSKPVLVTLPFLLLLLDFWPLRRIPLKTPDSRLKALLPLLLEKLPFLLLAGVSSVITILAHRGLGMLDHGSLPPLAFRLENALVSYARYLGNALWPSKLAVFYPLPSAWPAGIVALSAVLLLAITALAVRTVRSRPYLSVGWFWFAGVLVPFIGLIQAGAQALADRFAYLPLIGLLLGLVWAVAEWSRGWPHRSRILSFGAVVVLLVSAGLTRRQVGHWKNTETLFRHALAVTEGNFLAHGKLGEELAARGRLQEAEAQFSEAIRINPAYLPVMRSLATRLRSDGKSETALHLFKQAVQLRPQDATAHYNLAVALADAQNVSEALREYNEALRLDPDLAPAHNNLASLLLVQGQAADALSHALTALRLQPDFPQARFNAGNALFLQGKFADAAAHYTEAARLDPGHAEARLNLAKALVNLDQPDEAEPHLKEAARLLPASAEPHQILATLYSASKRSSEAVREYATALELDPNWAEGLNALAWILATHTNSAVRDASRAVQLAMRATNLTGSTNAAFVETLAAAYAEAGMFAEAVSFQQLACTLVASQGGAVMFSRQRLELYRAQEPLREP